MPNQDNYISQAQERVKLLHTDKRSWRAVADYLGLDHPIPYDFAVKGIVPKDIEKRWRLGIFQYQDLFSLESKVLKWMFENREEF